ncbi:MaoC family dehydratase [Sphingomonas guangdongensis]|uniref:MaoC family dehydratase n=1 Tax=Sphingomonas guangdongensis TaxID=1141890 RepID=UPI003CCBC3D0
MTPITMEERSRQIGTETVSDWVAVTQEMVDRFADVTGDHQFIHVDPVRAAATPFGGTIAHGFLTLSLMPQLIQRAPQPVIAGIRMVVNAGCNRLRFVQPVRAGARVRGRFALRELVEKRPGQWQQVTDFTVEIEGEDKPAIVSEWISQIYL